MFFGYRHLRTANIFYLRGEKAYNYAQKVSATPKLHVADVWVKPRSSSPTKSKTESLHLGSTIHDPSVVNDLGFSTCMRNRPTSSLVKWKSYSFLHNSVRKVWRLGNCADGPSLQTKPRVQDMYFTLLNGWKKDYPRWVDDIKENKTVSHLCLDLSTPHPELRRASTAGKDFDCWRAWKASLEAGLCVPPLEKKTLEKSD